MARSKRRTAIQSRPARPFSALGHTAGRPAAPRSLSDYEPASLAEIREAFMHPFGAPVRPLIRTVLPEREPGWQSPPRRGKRQSALVPVRATLRSSDRATRSPFLNATTVTPQLTERAIVCAKRSIRREVIFATRKTGKGAGAPRRKPSKVKC